MHKLALVTGSFDPITVGHVDIVCRAAEKFDRVILLVAQNAEKQYLFSPEERVQLAKAALADVPNVTVEFWDGMVADFARAHGASAFVRGIRNTADASYEQAMAEKNRELCGIETVFLPADAKYLSVSSTAVRALLQSGTDVGDSMPRAAAELARRILRDRTIGK